MENLGLIRQLQKHCWKHWTEAQGRLAQGWLTHVPNKWKPTSSLISDKIQSVTPRAASEDGTSNTVWSGGSRRVGCSFTGLIPEPSCLPGSWLPSPAYIYTHTYMYLYVYTYTQRIQMDSHGRSCWSSLYAPAYRLKEQRAQDGYTRQTNFLHWKPWVGRWEEKPLCCAMCNSYCQLLRAESVLMHSQEFMLVKKAKQFYLE